MRDHAYSERSPLVTRIEADENVESRLAACLEQSDLDRLQVVAQHLLLTVAYSPPVTAIAVWLSGHVSTMGALVGLLVGAILVFSAGQSIITAVLGLGQILPRLTSVKGRRGYGMFLLATAVEI